MLGREDPLGCPRSADSERAQEVRVAVQTRAHLPGSSGWHPLSGSHRHGRVHLQGHLVVAASDLAIRSLASHAQRPVEIGGAEHLLAQLQQPLGGDEAARPTPRTCTTDTRSAPPPFPAHKTLGVCLTGSAPGAGPLALYGCRKADSLRPE